MAATVGSRRVRTAAWAVAGLVTVVALVDAGSCSLARIQVDDSAKSAARVAVQTVNGQPINQATAEAAYAAADTALPSEAESIVIDDGQPGVTAQDFRLGPDGSITLTVQRTAPTLAFKYLPVLEDYTVASVTVTQQPLGM